MACRAALEVVVQFQPIRASQNAGGEQGWVSAALGMVLRCSGAFQAIRASRQEQEWVMSKLRVFFDRRCDR